jgi:hypothetical protein
MPGWLGFVVAAIIGSGGLAGITAPFVHHKLQQRREREQEARAQLAAWAAQQRQVCTALLDLVIRYRSQLHTYRSLHDNRASRFTASKTLDLILQQLPSLGETMRSVRRELDLEPNALLQEAIVRWGDAEMAYQQALTRHMSAWWNPVQRYFGKTPVDEVNHLADDFDARTEDLQAAVREYMASVELSLQVTPTRKLPKLPRLPWPSKLPKLPWKRP